MQPNDNYQPPVPQPPPQSGVPQPQPTPTPFPTQPQPVQPPQSMPVPVAPPQSLWSQPTSLYGSYSSTPSASSPMASDPTLPSLTPSSPLSVPLHGPASLVFPMWLRAHWKIVTLTILGIVILLSIAFQFIYPADRLLPGTKVDGVSLGLMREADAVTKLNNLYGDLTLAIYFGQNQAAFQAPQFKDIGVNTDNSTRLATIRYPWYLRLIPGSFFWAGNLGLKKLPAPTYTYDNGKIDNYTQSKVGVNCTIPPSDATLKLVGDQLQVVPSVPGGTCDITQFQQALASVQPSPSGNNSVHITIQETPPNVNNDKASALANTLNNRTVTPMPINVAGTTENIVGSTVLSWLDFQSYVPVLPAGQSNTEAVRDGSKLTFTVNTDRMAAYMDGSIAPKVAVPAGTTKISTSDFTVTSQVNGQTGLQLDVNRTASDVENYLNSQANTTTAETQPVAPSIVYSRTYSPTSNGFAALLAQYPQEHAGTYAASFTEITGIQPYRSASYRGNQPMVSDGSEDGYVGYAVLMGLQDQSILHSTQIFGTTNTDTCLTNMLEKFDQNCGQGFMNLIGNETLVTHGNELGLTGTTFDLLNTKTTTNDLVHFLVNLFHNQVAPSANGAEILSSMESNRIRTGIPAGEPQGTDVANVVGQGGTVNNDAAIVYSLKGVYALAIMSDGASQADLANLTSKIEALHEVTPPTGSH